ncbi:MAG TPA: glycosyltransferase [Flavobacteriia bacterium]|nr:glycosyltransferase [Flavobacteriia bacterium]
MLKSSKPKIIVDVERMKYAYTGLYFYCKNLAVNLEEYHSDKFDFYFYTYPKVKFPPFLKKINRKIIDKFLLIKPSKYKLWHSTWQDTKYIPKNNIKFVYTIHDLNFLYTDKPEAKKQKLLEAVQKKINRADAITVISNFVKEDVEKNLDLNGKKINVIYNGVDVKAYPNFNNPKYKPKNKFLFTVGTVLYKKHFHVLPQLLVDNDYELIIAGIHPDKAYLKKIKQEVEKYGVSDRVHLPGPISDEEKYWYTTHCEAFLFPSISEGFGLPPIEAMRFGKPVFLSTFTSLPEVGGDKAYYFKNFETEHMQQVLKEGLEDYHKHNRRPEIIRWSEQFSWVEASKQYVAVYQQTLGIPVDTKPLKKEMPKVTAIIPTLNEEQNIEDAIDQVQWADEILVIDSFSNDQTFKIAQKLGVKVIQRAFDDFSSQKNYAINQAENDWIFILDADEYITPDLQSELIYTLKNNKNFDGFWIPRHNYFKNIRVKYSGWQHDKVLRLFKKNKCKYNGKLVHEEVNCNGQTAQLKSPILHYTYNDYQTYLNKINHYANLKAKEMYAKGIKPNWFQACIKSAYRFIYHYVITFGFLDGKTGWTIAKINALGMRQRYNELRKIYKQNKS